MSSISCFRRARAGGLCCKGADLYTRQRAPNAIECEREKGRETVQGGRHETLACRATRAAEPVGIRPTIAARNSLRFGREPVEASTGYASGRGCRRRRQLKGAHLRLCTRRLQPRPGLRQYSLADSGI